MALKKKPNYFEWLLNDTEVIIPMTLFIGRWGIFIVYAIVLGLMLYNKMYNGWTIFIGVLVVFAAWQLIKTYRFGGFKNMRGMSINKLVYGGKK